MDRDLQQRHLLEPDLKINRKIEISRQIDL